MGDHIRIRRSPLPRQPVRLAERMPISRNCLSDSLCNMGLVLFQTISDSPSPPPKKKKISELPLLTTFNFKELKKMRPTRIWQLH